jgi:hypothetical protein
MERIGVGCWRLLPEPLQLGDKIGTGSLESHPRRMDHLFALKTGRFHLTCNPRKKVDMGATRSVILLLLGIGLVIK